MEKNGKIKKFLIYGKNGKMWKKWKNGKKNGKNCII